MKSYEEFLYQKQLDESLFSRAVGAANRVSKGLSKMGSAAGGAAKSVAKNVKTNVPKAVNQVKKTTANVQKEVGKNSRPGRFGAARVLGNRNVRSGLSALKNAASNIRGKTYSGQSLGTTFQSGSGVGSEISQGVKDRKKFERSRTVQYNKPGGSASGQKLPTSRTVVQRGRELDKDGNAIDRGKRGKSVLNKVTSKLRRNIGLSDVKDRTPIPPKPGESNPNAKGPTKPNITGPGVIKKEPATSGGKSKGTEPVSVLFPPDVAGSFLITPGPVILGFVGPFAFGLLSPGLGGIGVLSFTSLRPIFLLNLLVTLLSTLFPLLPLSIV
jgi:hypothetical protein